MRLQACSVVGLALIVSAVQLARAQESELDAAVAVVAELHAALVEVAELEPRPSLDERARILAPVVSQALDLAEMGRLTVRRFWRGWGEAERARFIAAFERLSAATYASRFAEISADNFAILGGELADETVVVHALVKRKDGGEDVTLDYTLGFDDARDTWRILKIEADGANELSVMASQYFTILEEGDLDDLIAEIEREIAALRR